MKPLCIKFFAAFLFLVAAFNAKAQTYSYIPFPASNFSWKGYTYSGAHGSGDVDYWTYSTDADTIINNLTYHKLVSSSRSFLVREDSNRRVYFIATFIFGNPEILLYDFS